MGYPNLGFELTIKKKVIKIFFNMSMLERLDPKPQIGKFLEIEQSAEVLMSTGHLGADPFGFFM